MRLLKERAQYSPLSGARRVFLIDSIDRANEEAANSLLKTLEEPPSYLVLVLTAQNPYDLLPTIRSRAVPLRLTPLSENEMREFTRVRSLDSVERRIALASGSPGLAATWDLEAYDKRREAMLALLETAGGVAPFSTWARYAEKVSAARSEKLEAYLKVLYLLLEDVLHLREGTGPLRNIDERERLATLAAQLPAERSGFDWMREAILRIDGMIEMLRRNIQKTIALDALVLELRAVAG
jgi:DNA polymerase-3 subunit delta'